MEKIGISTDIGLNYGSLLQVFATKVVLKSIGYEAVVFKPGGSIVKNKDVRIAKLVGTMGRLLLHSKSIISSLSVYRDIYLKDFCEDTTTSLVAFLLNEVNPQEFTLQQLKTLAKTDEYVAFLCGSDQIWVSDTYYIDPFYYLSYAPSYKRIAWAPSFGREFVSDYNKKKIAKNISEIPYLSVREISGANIIKQLTGRVAEVILDPTLILSPDEWSSYLPPTPKSDYILAYFLDKPSIDTVKVMQEFAASQCLPIVGIPYTFSSDYSDIVPKGVGPYEFVRLIKGAKSIFTDSFHGTAFSLNMNVPFYTFERNYGSATNQSTRIKSLLQITGTQSRFYSPGDIVSTDIDFDYVNNKLKEEREKGRYFLNNAIMEVKSHG